MESNVVFDCSPEHLGSLVGCMTIKNEDDRFFGVFASGGSLRYERLCEPLIACDTVCPPFCCCRNPIDLCHQFCRLPGLLDDSPNLGINTDPIFLKRCLLLREYKPRFKVSPIC